MTAYAECIQGQSNSFNYAFDGTCSRNLLAEQPRSDTRGDSTRVRNEINEERERERERKKIRFLKFNIYYIPKVTYMRYEIHNKYINI